MLIFWNLSYRAKVQLDDTQGCTDLNPSSVAPQNYFAL
jgi:hypothetical protein